MIITYLGTEYEFDLDKVGVDEWREVKKKYGLTPKAVESGLNEADPDAMTFAYWVMLRQNGQQQHVLGDHLKPDILALNHAIGTAAETEHKATLATAAAEAAPDPTSGSASPAPSPPAPETPAPPQPSGEVSAQTTGS